MDLQAITFWLLSAVMVASALAVVSARNPVHSVLFLITAFFSAAGLFVLLGAEFLAMLLVIVYVGAVLAAAAPCWATLTATTTISMVSTPATKAPMGR